MNILNKVWDGVVMKHIYLGFLFFAMFSLFSEIKEDPVVIDSARTSAIGGRHSALADDFSTLFSNPAGFLEAGPEFSAAELTFTFSGPIFDIANIVAESNGDVSGDDISGLLEGLYANFGLTGPLSLGYVGNGLGFGVVSRTYSRVQNSITNKIVTTLSSEVTILGGYSYRIPLADDFGSKFDVGMLFKSSVQGKSEIIKGFLEFQEMVDDISTDLITQEEFALILKNGVDIGTRYSMNDVFTFSLVAYDAYTPTVRYNYDTMQDYIDGKEHDSKETGVVPMDLTLGFMYSPESVLGDKYFSDFKLMFDYKDTLGFYTHPRSSKNMLLLLGLGTEITFLDVLDVRLGFNEGLLAAGVGLDFGFMKINTAMYGTELGTEPGMNPVFNLQLGIEFRY